MNVYFTRCMRNLWIPIRRGRGFAVTWSIASLTSRQLLFQFINLDYLTRLACTFRIFYRISGSFQLRREFRMFRYVTHLQNIYVVSNGYVNNKWSVNVQGLRTPDIYYFTILPHTYIHTYMILHTHHIHAGLTREHRIGSIEWRNSGTCSNRFGALWYVGFVAIAMVTSRMNNQVDLEQWRRRARRSETRFSVSWPGRAQKRNIGIYGLAAYKMRTIAEYRFHLKRGDAIRVKLIYRTKELKVEDLEGRRKKKF